MPLEIFPHARMWIFVVSRLLVSPPARIFLIFVLRLERATQLKSPKTGARSIHLAPVVALDSIEVSSRRCVRSTRSRPDLCWIFLFRSVFSIPAARACPGACFSRFALAAASQAIPLEDLAQERRERAPDLGPFSFPLMTTLCDSHSPALGSARQSMPAV
jgi:hypothetical protein